MANSFLTLLDITKRSGTSSAVGLIEEVNTVAPEISLYGRPINGISYSVRVRTALPGTGENGFRNVNEGAPLVSSKYERKTASCYLFDAQMRVDEGLIAAMQGEGATEAEILADEASGVVQQRIIDLGDQFYRGFTKDSKGFPGLLSLYDSTNCEVSATGSSGSATSVWLIWNTIRGVHWIWGNNQGLNMRAWTTQQVEDSDGKAYMARVNNLSGYVGVGFGHQKSAVRVKLVTSSKPFTDAVGAEALAKLPIFMRNDKANLRWLMNTNAALWLQKSRSATTNNSATPLQFAPQPTESNGVQIILTDSIGNAE